MLKIEDILFFLMKNSKYRENKLTWEHLLYPTLLPTSMELWNFTARKNEMIHMH